jgi:flagellar basal body-associated protein FliL
MAEPAIERPRPSGRQSWRNQALPALVMLIAVWGCAGTTSAVQGDSPDWLNTVVTAQERVAITPSMSVADRLTELRRAKEAAYDRMLTMVLALQTDDHETIEALVARQPRLRQQIESYVRRVAVVDTEQGSGPVEIHARVEVGLELYNLIRVKRTPTPVDRNTPSTSIVRPL